MAGSYIEIDFGYARADLADADEMTSSLAGAHTSWSVRLASVAVVGIAAVVVVLGVGREFLVYLVGDGTFLQEGRHFDLDEEANLPSWFTAVEMAAIAALCAMHASASRGSRDPSSWGWVGLALAFTMLSLDEVGSFHEALMGPLRDYLHAGGIFHNAWIVPAIPLVGLFALLYIPFLQRLPRRYGGLFFLSGTVFVAGALGMEMVDGLIASGGNESGVAYAVATTVEETLEISGMTLFLVSLLHYARHRRITLTIA